MRATLNKLIKIISFTIAFILAVSLIPPFTVTKAAEIASGTCGDNLTWTLDDKGILTISGSGEMEDYYKQEDDPSPWYSYRDLIKIVYINDGTTNIGDYAFYNCNSLTSVEIPSSVTSIGYAAFYGCSSLTSIAIPSRVISIGVLAFANCSRLTNIAIPSGVIFIGGAAFGGCSNLTSIAIPTGVTSIEERTFYGCSSLTSVKIPSNVASIGVYAFYGCSNLTSVEIPSSVTSIGEEAFGDCSSLTSVEIPSGVTSIGDGAFWSCSSLTSMAIPSGVTSIGDGVFCDCSNLTSIAIPSNVTSIGNGAFQGCSSLTSIAIPSGVTSIGVNAFQDCSSLTSMKIPSSVTSIGDDTFWGCINLTSVEIPSSVTSIGVGAFGECSSLTSVEIPSSVTSIGDVAFGYCSSLTSIAIPSGVTSIKVGAFRECSSLISVEIPSSVTSIGIGAFWGCSNLTSIAIPSGVTSIGSSAFRDCSSLTSVEIPSSVTSIGDVAFGYCSSLTSIAIPSGVTSIGNSAFRECSSLTSVKIPSSVTSIGVNAFQECSSLTSIAIPSGVTSIGNYTFYECSNLTNIVIPPGVTSIGEYAFWGCSSLTSIEIPSSVTSIGADAFEECSSLESISVAAENPVYDSREECNAIIETSTNKLISGCMNTIIPSSVTSIEEYAFWGCSSLTSVEIPSSVTSIGVGAFWGCSNLESISVAAENPVYDSREGCNAIIETSTNKLISGCMNTIIPSSVTSIGESAFGRCSNLTSIAIPSSVTSIEAFAFANCFSLTSIAIPSGVTSIGFSAFRWCNSLKDITIPNSVTEIGTSSFYGCSNLTSIEIPSGVTSIGEEAFKDCSSLTSVEIPNSVTDIGDNAFLDSSIADVYYEGTEDKWNSLNYNDFKTANLFTVEDLDDSLNLDIAFIDVPGGVAVTISSIGSEIFYTLDGSIPCTASIPYEGTFIIDEPGEYFINARAFNLDEGQCSPVSTEYVNLEQSENPEIHERNGQITITGEGDIYYSLDVTDDPTTDSYRYTAPLRFSETTVIKARCIEEGKAASEVIGYTYYAGSSDGITFPEESYSFKNTKQSFGYTGFGYRIPEERYTEIFGSAVGEFLYDEYGADAWGGSCFGMSATSILFHKSMLNLKDYSDEAGVVYDLLAPSSSDSMLTKLIERYQISQFLPTVMEERGDVSDGGNMVISGLSGNETEAEALLDAVRSGLKGGDPVILIVWRQDLAGSHAVVPYKVEDGKIYVYDCNNPGKERYITYKVNNNGTYSFGFGEYSYAVSYNQFSTLMNGLESNVDIGTAVLSSEEEERMLISIDSTDVTILDTNGDEVDLINYRATEDIETDNTVVCIKTGTYKIINKDLSLDSITISAATDDDYQKVTVNDPDAVVEVRERNGKVYFCVTSKSDTKIVSSIMSGNGYENNISLTSSYAEIYSTTDRTVAIRTKATAAVINGKTEEMGNDELEPEYFFGAAVSPDAETGARLYREGEQYTLSTDITSLPGEDFNLTVLATGGDENTMLYTASYSDTGRMIALKGVRMTAGKTRYPFSISQNAADVKVFMLNADRALPLISSLTIR